MDIKITPSDFPDGDSNILDLEKVPADCKIEDLKIDYEGLDRIDNFIVAKLNRTIAESGNLSNREKVKLERKFYGFIYGIYSTSLYRALYLKIEKSDSKKFMTAYSEVVEKKAKATYHSIDKSKLNIPMYIEIINVIFMVAHTIFSMPYYCYIMLSGKFKS